MGSEENKNLLRAINNCMVPKLRINYDEAEHHNEYYERINSLDEKISHLLNLLRNQPNECICGDANLLSSIFLLNKELKTVGEWNSDNSIELSSKLDAEFEIICKTNIESTLSNTETYNTQEVFELCLKKLHEKLTQEDYKKHPSLIEVYCLIAKDLNNYHVKLTPTKVLPFGLVLLGDHVESNKVKALMSCNAIFAHLTVTDFENSNFHEVIYGNLMSLLTSRNLEVIKLLLECVDKLLSCFEKNIKDKTMDDLINKILHEIQMDANIERKSLFMSFLTHFLEMNGVESAKRKMRFNDVIIETVDLCINEAVRDVLLDGLLKCLKIWYTHCWCVWDYDLYYSDRKMISMLLKLLYVLDDKEAVAGEELVELINLLISLCQDNQRKHIVMSMINQSQLQNKVFNDRINNITNRHVEN